MNKIAQLARESRDPGLIDLHEARFQVFSDVPFREVFAHLAKIRNVADVVAFAILLDVFVQCRFP